MKPAPVWHASVAAYPIGARVSARVLRRVAFTVLASVGDRAAGQWEELGDVAFHLRRRLTAEEQASVGPAIDVRGTKEATSRLAAMPADLMAYALRMAAKEGFPPTF